VACSRQKCFFEPAPEEKKNLLLSAGSPRSRGARAARLRRAWRGGGSASQLKICFYYTITRGKSLAN
jgi:hypothetical protein